MLLTLKVDGRRRTIALVKESGSNVDELRNLLL